MALSHVQPPELWEKALRGPVQWDWRRGAPLFELGFALLPALEYCHLNVVVVSACTGLVERAVLGEPDMFDGFDEQMLEDTYREQATTKHP